MSVRPDDVLSIVLMMSSVVATSTILLALYHMKHIKRTTVVFLANLAISILLHGATFMANTILHVLSAFDNATCLTWVVLFTTPAAHYLTGILFVYLDLYLSLKKLSIGKPVISARLAVAMCLLSLLCWSALCSLGFAMRREDFAYSAKDGCTFVCGVVKKGYVLYLVLCLAVIFAIIVLLHVFTYRLVTKSQQQFITVRSMVVSNHTHPPECSSRNTKQSVKSKWVNKNSVVLKTITMILVVLTVTWCPASILYLIIAYCEPCRLSFYREVIYISYILIGIQYNSNGVIYLVKIKELRQACKRLWCRCSSDPNRIQPIEREKLSVSNNVLTTTA